MYLKDSLRDFLEKTKTKDMPGGGSVVGYTASLGAALTLMVANLSFGKKRYESKSEEIKNLVKEDYQELEDLIEELLKKMEEDAKSFDGVLEAMRLPKETEEEKEFRKEKIQEGYVLATETPLETGELVVKTMNAQKNLAYHGDIYAITDQGAGTLLLAASGEAALLNVIVNLKSMVDSDKKTEIKQRYEKCIQEIHDIKEELMKSCYGRLDEM
ncbi:MAG: cyclodeaminase/cyclohydrolase family protein [Tissierellia bacterium]|nr:cyclodeaminase/cyclohydrolase family protein [Tissierellia bacterium]